MAYTVKTENGSYRFTHDELVEIANKLILKRNEFNHVDKLFDIVTNYYNVQKHNVMSSSRKQEYVEARRVLSYMLTEHAGYSSKAAGRVLAIDHSTILYHVRYIKDSLNVYEDTKRVIDHCIKQFYDEE